MPRLINKTPKYSRHRASGLAYVTLDGRDIYLGRYDSAASRAEYDRLIAIWLANGRRQPTAAADPFIAEICLGFVKAHESYYRRADGTPTGELDNFKLVIRPLVRLYGRSRASEFGPLALKALRAEMIKMGWSRTGINRQIHRVRQMFNWAASEQMIPGQIYVDLCTVVELKTGRSEARETEPVTPAPEAHIAAAVRFMPPTVREMVKLQLLTGMRSSELCAMRSADIDTSGPIWHYKPPQHKTLWRGQVRIIDLGSRAQAIVGPLLKPEINAYLFSPAAGEQQRRASLSASRTTPLSCGNKPGSNRKTKPRRTPGDCYDARSYGRAVKRACDRADEWAKGGVVIGNDEQLMPPWHPHQLRHNFATAVRKRFGEAAVSAAIGDKSVKMVDLYAERDRSVAMKIAEAIG